MKFTTLSTLALAATASAFAPATNFAGLKSTQLEASRTAFISGNWKLNPQTREEAVTLASEIASSIGPDSPKDDVALFVPYVFIEAAMEAVDGKLKIGAEVRNINHHVLTYDD